MFVCVCVCEGKKRNQVAMPKKSFKMNCVSVRLPPYPSSSWSLEQTLRAGYQTPWPRTATKTLKKGLWNQVITQLTFGILAFKILGKFSQSRLKNQSLTKLAAKKRNICFVINLIFVCKKIKFRIKNNSTKKKGPKLFNIGWKCCFPMNPHVRLLVGLSVCHNFLNGRKLQAALQCF